MEWKAEGNGGDEMMKKLRDDHEIFERVDHENMGM